MMKIGLKTLTPLWTGDVSGKSSFAKETGIIGSLRWWYEALIRGLGGYACDPTGDDGCSLKYDKGKGDQLDQKLKSLCNACHLFGATGWGSLFRIDMSGWSTNKVEVLTQFGPKGNQVDVSWWLGKTLGKPLNAITLNGTSSTNIVPLRGDNETEIENIILFLIALISKAGAIGSKAQNGFGVYEITGLENFKERTRKGYSLIKGSLKRNLTAEQGRLQLQVHYPNFKNFFVLDVTIDNHDNKSYVSQLKRKPLSGFAIRYYLRKRFKDEKKDGLPVHNFSDLDGLRSSLNQDYFFKEYRDHFHGRELNKMLPQRIVARHLFGSDLSNKDATKGKWGSKIYVSNTFVRDENVHFRVWGEIPESLVYNYEFAPKNQRKGSYTTKEIEVKFNREKTINKIMEYIKDGFGVSNLQFSVLKSGIDILNDMKKGGYIDGI